MRVINIIILQFISFFLVACNSDNNNNQEILPGSYNTSQYINQLKGKNIGVVANHSSLINNTHLVDSLIALNINIKRIFSPEHGFRGNQDAGATVQNDVDSKTNIEVVSLYGRDKKPQPNNLQDLDILVFDIQDVGVRFYTYLSTLHYIMEAAAENNIKVIVLDRPNPNGFYVDGPILNTDYKSFVGMHPIPIVHGMTLGELAQMINGEKWLKGEVNCNLEVIQCQNYTHKSLYKLPVKPSPNLPNMTSVYLYPSLALFEGTIMSVGRGTDFPFQTYGNPNYKGDFTFTPKSITGASSSPKHMKNTCYGVDLRVFDINNFVKKPAINLDYIIEAFTNMNADSDFFNPFFKNLAGNEELKNQILKSVSAKEIKLSWKNDIETFKQKRKKYLLYPDFE